MTTTKPDIFPREPSLGEAIIVCQGVIEIYYLKWLVAITTWVSLWNYESKRNYTILVFLTTSQLINSDSSLIYNSNLKLMGNQSCNNH